MKNSITILLALISVLVFTAANAQSTNLNSKRGSQPSKSSTQASKEDYAKYFICASPDSKRDEAIKINYIVISLAEQRLYAYQDNELVAWSNCSTGKTGHETPVGTFKITQKHIDHYSSIYNNAPMPYFMRLTNDGVGLHAGELPGYAASHGCIRLPLGMVKELYKYTPSGTPVQVIAEPVDPAFIANRNPSLLAKN